MPQSISKDARSYRLTNIDFLRGLVIVIMAIDHVRDYVLMGTSLDPMNQPDVSVSLYLTRWVTHFCAPVFVFLAGTSAGLMASRKSPRELGAFLLKRGLWLIFVEAAIISTSLTFSPQGIAELGGATFVFLQVIWAIGASMVLLGAAQFLGPRACLYLGILILLAYNSLDSLWPVPDVQSGTSSLLALLFYQGSYTVGPFFIMEVYPLLAWFAVMLLGYGSSFIFEKEPAERNTLLIRIGLSFIIAFIVLRTSGLYGDGNPWQRQSLGAVATVFDFMNVTKYPPSLLFLLATLGPMAIVCGLVDRMSGWFKTTMVMFGRVPFAFYVAHIIAIHLMAMGLGMFQGFPAEKFMTFFLFFPEGFGTSLPGVYLGWLLLLAILYPFCRWMADLKTRRKDWWLSYL
jgi:uncharacterized membrane protein